MRERIRIVVKGGVDTVLHTVLLWVDAPRDPSEQDGFSLSIGQQATEPKLVIVTIVGLDKVLDLPISFEHRK